MPSVPTHMVVGVALGQGASAELRAKWRLWIAAMACSAIPDLDVIGFRFGVHYGDFWGHRGFTHSLLFAGILGIAVGMILGRDRKERLVVIILLSFITASHGLLDAMTDGGLGVAFFSPFNLRRYFLQWRPIHVSPLAVGRFASGGIRILTSEAKYVWLPSAIVGTILYLLHSRRVRSGRAEVQGT